MSVSVYHPVRGGLAIDVTCIIVCVCRLCRGGVAGCKGGVVGGRVFCRVCLSNECTFN